MNKTTEALAIEALEMIAGERVCIDNLMSDKDIARQTLAAIREALAEPVKQDTPYCKCAPMCAKPCGDESCVEPVKQEPVACVNRCDISNGKCADCPDPAPVDAKAIRAEALEEAAKFFDGKVGQADLRDVAAVIRGLK